MNKLRNSLLCILVFLLIEIINILIVMFKIPNNPLCVPTKNYLSYEIFYSIDITELSSIILAYYLKVPFTKVLLVLLLSINVLCGFVLYKFIKNVVKSSVYALIPSLMFISIPYLYIHDIIFFSYFVSFNIALLYIIYVLLINELKVRNLIVLYAVAALSFISFGYDPRVILFPLILLFLMLMLSLIIELLTKSIVFRSLSIKFLRALLILILVMPLLYVFQFLPRTEISSYVPFVASAFIDGQGFNYYINMLLSAIFWLPIEEFKKDAVLLSLLLCYPSILLISLVIYVKISANIETRYRETLHSFIIIAVIYVISLALFTRVDQLSPLVYIMTWLQKYKYLIPQSIQAFLTVTFRTPRLFGFITYLTYVYSCTIVVYYIQLVRTKGLRSIKALKMFLIVMIMLAIFCHYYVLYRYTSVAFSEWTNHCYALGDEYVIWSKFRILPGRIEKVAYEYFITNEKIVPAITNLHKYVILENPWRKLVSSLLKEPLMSKYFNIIINASSILVLKSRVSSFLLPAIFVLQGESISSELFEKYGLIAIPLDHIDNLKVMLSVAASKLRPYLVYYGMDRRSVVGNLTFNILFLKGFGVCLSSQAPEIITSKYSFMHPAYVDDPHHGVFIEPRDYEYDFTLTLNTGMVLNKGENEFVISIPQRVVSRILQHCSDECPIIIGIRAYSHGSAAKVTLLFQNFNESVTLHVYPSHGFYWYYTLVSYPKEYVEKMHVIVLHLKSNRLLAVNTLVIAPYTMYKDIELNLRNKVLFIELNSKDINSLRLNGSIVVKPKEHIGLFERSYHFIASNLNLHRYYVLLFGSKPYDAISFNCIGAKCYAVMIDYAEPAILIIPQNSHIVITISVIRQGITNLHRILAISMALSFILMYLLFTYRRAKITLSKTFQNPNEL